MRSCAVNEPRISRRSTDSASDGDTPSDSRSGARLQEHVALAPEIPRRPALRAFHFRDLAAQRLPLGDERQQLPIERAQAFA